MVKFFKDREANDLKNFFQKMQKFYVAYLQLRVEFTLELSGFKLVFLTFHLY